MVEPVGMAAIQDQNTGDPDKGAFDKRPIPDLNSQWVKPRAWLDKIARVAMLWVEKVAADRSSVNEDAGAKQVCGRP